MAGLCEAWPARDLLAILLPERTACCLWMALLSAVCALDLVVTGISHDNLDSTLPYTPYAGLDTQRSRLSGHAIYIRPMPFLLTRYLNDNPGRCYHRRGIGENLGGCSCASPLSPGRIRRIPSGFRSSLSESNVYTAFGYAFWS